MDLSDVVEEEMHKMEFPDMEAHTENYEPDEQLQFFWLKYIVGIKDYKEIIKYM